MRIKFPPKLPDYEGSIIGHIAKHHAEDMGDYINYYSVSDSKGRYLPFDSFRHRVPKKLDTNLAWALTKMARDQQTGNVDIPIYRKRYGCPFHLTSNIQKAISIVDRNTTTSALNHMIGQNEPMKFLLDDLAEDEAISSSQLEGAATTTSDAKVMIKRKLEPRDMDERMIIGNLKMMAFAWKNRSKSLDIDLIQELHSTGVEGIDDEKYSPGIFRKSGDNVVVEDQYGEIIHTPPPAKGLDNRIRSLCDWVNTCHDDAETANFVHPLVKSSLIHFFIGFEHPFKDGNGRVARALFYWFMFKSGYGAMKHIAISTHLKEGAANYVKSYLYTESDGLDLTYFVDHQCKVMMKAVGAFLEKYKQTVEELREFESFLWDSGLYSKLNHNQMVVFNVAKSGIAADFTINNVKDNLGCAYNTAASILNGLVDLKVFTKSKQGRVWVYKMYDKEAIIKQWA